jgi:hypothetical protein
MALPAAVKTACGAGLIDIGHTLRGERSCRRIVSHLRLSHFRQMIAQMVLLRVLRHLASKSCLSGRKSRRQNRCKYCPSSCGRYGTGRCRRQSYPKQLVSHIGPHLRQTEKQHTEKHRVSLGCRLLGCRMNSRMYWLWPHSRLRVRRCYHRNFYWRWSVQSRLENSWMDWPSWG